MTGWEAVLEWSAGGPNRGIAIDRPVLMQHADGTVSRTFCVAVGLVESVEQYGEGVGSFFVCEEGNGDTLDEAAAAALAAWRKRML